MDLMRGTVRPMENGMELNQPVEVRYTYIYLTIGILYFICLLRYCIYVDQNIHLCNSCGLWYS